MFEPDILTIGELAARWQQTPLQIINHAQALRVPLYFAFEGLVFDVGDHWHRGTGDYDQTREIGVLSASITQREAQIKRNARGDVGQWEQPLTSDDTIELRTEIEANKRKRTALTELLEQRSIERNRCEYRGYLRAAPSTLWDIATIGAAPFPRKAFHPHSPVHIAKLPDRSGHVWDGRMVALEPGPGCDRYKKDTLTIDDLHAFMVEVKAIEAHQAAQQTAPASDTVPEQEAAMPAPVGTASDGPAPETKEQRQDRRLKACIDAGLPMNDKAASLRLPYGVGDIAELEGVTRQAFSTDVKAALERRASAKREGMTVHRA